MWQWLLSLFGMKPKALPVRRTNDELPEPEEELEVWESPLQPSLFSALAKAKQEALDPILPDELKEAVYVTVHKAFPESFKKNLMKKENLILISKHDVLPCFDKRPDISDEQWHQVKAFAIKELQSNGIPAESSDNFIKSRVEKVLEAIKDYNPPKEEQNPFLLLHQQGIYR